MKLFDRLFSKKPKLADGSFVNPITTDLHSHLLPGIDDGVQTIEESLDILRHLSSLGYKKVITTPHIMGDYYQNSTATILPLLEEVRSALKQQEIPIELHASAEYMVDDALLEKIDSGNILSFGHNHVLIEMPFMEPSPNLTEILFALNINGYKPVLAHPERYVYYGMNPRKYHDLWDMELLFQVNINSLIGYYSPQVQKAAEYLIEHKMVSMIGSDTHGMRHMPVLDLSLKSLNYQNICSLPLLNNSL
ncbi:MAG: CpsB/CapC family capsule biosynthesis tyrosine phosphatase [Bacteroidota bacterium]